MTKKKQSTHLEYRLICDSTRSIRALNGKVAIHVFDEQDVLNVATSLSPFFWLLCLVAPLSSEKNNQEKISMADLTSNFTLHLI